MYSRDALESVAKNLNHYALIINDSMIVCRCTDLANCLKELERTYAYGFYLAHDTNTPFSPMTGMPQPIPVVNHLTHDLNAWAFEYALRGDWREPLQMGMILRKNDCLQFLLKCYDKEMAVGLPELDSVGLCYDQPKVLCYILKK